MTASSADTAELPVTGRTVVATVPRMLPAAGPVVDGPCSELHIEPSFLPVDSAESAVASDLDVAPIEPVSPALSESSALSESPGVEVGPTARPACRAELRAQRLQARRVRRRYAALGLSVLGATLGATVIALDMLH